MKTLYCKKCGYVAKYDSDKELNKEIKKHQKQCDGILERPFGKCLINAFMNCIEHPQYLFCYSFLKTKENQTFLHAWSETSGYVEKNEVVTSNKDGSNLKNKNKEDFVFDFLQDKRIILRKKDYYKQNSIEEKNVRKLTFKKLINQINNCLEKDEDIWSWLHF